MGTGIPPSSAATWSRRSCRGRYVSSPAWVTDPVSGFVSNAVIVAADFAMLLANPAGIAPKPASVPGNSSRPARVPRPRVTDKCGRRPCLVNVLSAAFAFAFALVTLPLVGVGTGVLRRDDPGSRLVGRGSNIKLGADHAPGFSASTIDVDRIKIGCRLAGHASYAGRNFRIRWTAIHLLFRGRQPLHRRRTRICPVRDRQYRHRPRQGNQSSSASVASTCLV